MNPTRNYDIYTGSITVSTQPLGQRNLVTGESCVGSPQRPIALHKEVNLCQPASQQKRTEEWVFWPRALMSYQRLPLVELKWSRWAKEHIGTVPSGQCLSLDWKQGEWGRGRGANGEDAVRCLSWDSSTAAGLALRCFHGGLLAALRLDKGHCCPIPYPTNESKPTAGAGAVSVQAIPSWQHQVFSSSVGQATSATLSQLLLFVTQTCLWKLSSL